MIEGDAFDESQLFYPLDWLVRFPQALSPFSWSVDTTRQGASTTGWKSNIADLHLHTHPSSLLQLPRAEKGWWSLKCNCESEQVCWWWLTTILRSQLPLEADPELKYCLASLCGAAPSGVDHTPAPSSCPKGFFSKGWWWETPVVLSKAGESFRRNILLSPSDRQADVLWKRALPSEVISAAFSCLTVALWDLLVSTRYWGGESLNLRDSLKKFKHAIQAINAAWGFRATPNFKSVWLPSPKAEIFSYM